MRSIASTPAEPTKEGMIQRTGIGALSRRRLGALALIGFATALTTSAAAQTAPAGRAPAPAQAPAAAPKAPAAAPAAGAAATSATPAPPPQTPDIMAAVPGGITADQVAARAAQTSYQAKAAEENVTAAGERADAAWTQFLPRVGLLGRYTRLSDMTAPKVCVGGQCFSVTNIIVDNWLAQATITVPISDYFLKINQSYSAATKQADAARYDVVTARAKSYSDGKIAYFTWLRARGSLTVAEQNLAVAQAHLKDAQNQFSVGNASKADVLRAQTQVAAAELLVERGKSGIVITERQVRIATHASESEKLEPGESLDSAISPAPQDTRALVTEALGARPEIKSVDTNAEAMRKLANAQRANRYPALSGFGDVTYANPNQRRFPQTSDWFPTWSLGAQVTWSPNDLIAAGPQAGDYEARAAALEAQKNITRDGIEVEVTQAYQAVVEADTAIVTTTRQLESAEEGYRVARELFNAGRGTSTTLIDAENALAQTRFDHLNAKVDARIARIRLEHAVGHDLK